jgi:hypothetical protein
LKDVRVASCRGAQIIGYIIAERKKRVGHAVRPAHGEGGPGPSPYSGHAEGGHGHAPSRSPGPDEDRYAKWGTIN